MNRSVSQIARAFGTDSHQVKKWAVLFKEYLKPAANPAKGTARTFCDLDFLVLSYVFYNWEDNPDLEAIKIGLNQEDQHQDMFRECLYLNTPLLQEPPCNLDETWNHGFVLNGGGVNQYLELARSYRHGAEALLESALKSGEPREWGYPVLFAYRHTLELYLKIIGEVEEDTHSLKRCVHLVERHHGPKIGSPVKEWILEFDKIDPIGTAFRYADDEKGTLKWAEYWVDFVQFKFAMKQVFEMIDRAIIRTGAKGKPAKKKRAMSASMESRIATDYMGQAESLLREGQTGKYDHVPGAVLACAVLEKALRTLCGQQQPPISETNDKDEPKTLNPLIDDLKKAGAFNELKAKQLRSWADIRNKAAHGDFSAFTKQEVERMLRGINNFLADYLK